MSTGIVTQRIEEKPDTIINPADVGEVVKKSIEKIDDGIGGYIEEAVDISLNTYCTYVAKFPQVEIKTIDAAMVS